MGNGYYAFMKMINGRRFFLKDFHFSGTNLTQICRTWSQKKEELGIVFVTRSAAERCKQDVKGFEDCTIVQLEQ